MTKDLAKIDTVNGKLISENLIIYRIFKKFYIIIRFITECLYF